MDPKAKYFMLRFDKDPHALLALDLYATSVKFDNERLYDDLKREIESVFDNADESFLNEFNTVASRFV